MAPLLSVTDLRVAYRVEDGETDAVDGVSFTLDQSEKLGLVGESGCGKSTIGLAIMGLLPPTLARASGRIEFMGRDLLGADEATLRRIRGREIAMIFQDPMTALHPLLPVGRQIAETLEAHLRLTPRQARDRALDLLRMVGIAGAQQRLRAYPHEMSGGMCQRVMIAIALACGPKVLIADEPTTALDVTIQAQIFELVTRICSETHTALLLITHDLGVVAGMADRVVVLYAGGIVESALTDQLFAHPTHPYSRGLLASVPRIDNGLGEDLPVIPGSIETVAQSGCRFAPRCGYAQPKCHAAVPQLLPLAAGHMRACWVAPAQIAASPGPALIAQDETAT